MCRTQTLLSNIPTIPNDRFVSLSSTTPIFTSHNLLVFVICTSHSATYPWLGFLGESRQRCISSFCGYDFDNDPAGGYGDKVIASREESNPLKLHQRHTWGYSELNPPIMMSKSQFHSGMLYMTLIDFNNQIDCWPLP